MNYPQVISTMTPEQNIVRQIFTDANLKRLMLVYKICHGEAIKIC